MNANMLAMTLALAAAMPALAQDTTWTGAVTVDAPVRVTAGTLTIEPGTVVTFKETGVIDLARGARLSAKGTTEKPILLVGENTGQVRGVGWSGVFEHVEVASVGVADNNKRRWWLSASTGDGGITIRNCRMTDSGGATVVLGGGSLEIVGCDFRACGQGIQVRGKQKVLIEANTLEGAGIGVGEGVDATVRRNVVVRGTVSGGRVATLLVEENYVHQPRPGGTYGLLRTEGVIRNNVIRGGSWVTSQIGGEITGNVLISLPHEEARKREGGFDRNCTHEHICGFLANSRVIRNIFVGGSYAGVMGIGKGTGANSVIRNNTFDMHGHGHPVTLNHFPENKAENIIIRNNIFMRCGSVWNEWGTPGSVRSVDYNLWAGAGEKERFRNFDKDIAAGLKPGEPGFGGHDVPAFAERRTVLPPESIVADPDVKFPFTDEEMLARKHTAAEILKVYRDAYTLKADSPAIDAGDVADKDDLIVQDGKPDIGALERIGK